MLLFLNFYDHKNLALLRSIKLVHDVLGVFSASKLSMVNDLDSIYTEGDNNTQFKQS